MRASPAETVGVGDEIIAQEAGRVVLEGLSEEVSAVDSLPLLLDEDSVTPETPIPIDGDNLKEDEETEETSDSDCEKQSTAHINSADRAGKLVMQRVRRRGGGGSRRGCGACSNNTAEYFPGSKGNGTGCSSCQSKSGFHTMLGTPAA